MNTDRRRCEALWRVNRQIMPFLWSLQFERHGNWKYVAPRVPGLQRFVRRRVCVQGFDSMPAQIGV